MSKNKRNKIFAAAAIAIGLAAGGIGAANAASNSSATNPMSNLVNAIAQKFNLNTSDVQAVFDQQKAQIEAQMQQAFTNRINAAVTAGKLTQAQADLIIAKQAELKANEATFESMTPADRQAAMKTQMDSLKTWATTHNIPEAYLPLGGRGMGRGPGGRGNGFGRPHNATATTSPTPSSN